MAIKRSFLALSRGALFCASNSSREKSIATSHGTKSLRKGMSHMPVRRFAAAACHLGSAHSNHHCCCADDDKATSIRRRSMFKLLAELRLAGLYNEDAPLLAAVRSLADPDFARDRDRALMVLLLLGHFAKGCREELLGLAAKDATAALAQQAAAQVRCRVLQPTLTHMMKGLLEGAAGLGCQGCHRSAGAAGCHVGRAIDFDRGAEGPSDELAERAAEPWLAKMPLQRCCSGLPHR